MLAARVDTLQMLSLLLAQRSGQFHAQQLVVADDGIDGRADLVTHCSEKIALRPIRLLRLLACALRFERALCQRRVGRWSSSFTICELGLCFFQRGGLMLKLLGLRLELRRVRLQLRLRPPLVGHIVQHQQCASRPSAITCVTTASVTRRFAGHGERELRRSTVSSEPCEQALQRIADPRAVDIETAAGRAP
jgi:hypothetical protein